MSNVRTFPSVKDGQLDIVIGLRELANQIEKGELDITSLTVTSGNMVDHYGDVSQDIGERNAIYNLQRGLHIFLMSTIK